MGGDNLPSGREQAIETLIDMEPHGSFYRASRALDESVPQALLHRPNLVTKSALVEQAYALAKYEIDQLTKYDAVFGSRENACFSDRLVATPENQKERILRHHSKILAAKRGASKGSISPSPQLIAALRSVYGEGESLELRSFLQSVTDHPSFSKEEGSSVTATPDDSTAARGHQLESLIGSNCEHSGSPRALQGLMISVLSLVTGYEIKDGIKEDSKEESDPTSPPPLQVGAILSTIRPEEEDHNHWSLDSEFLDYLSKAAATYEERIEIQKTRLLTKLDERTESPFLERKKENQTAISTAATPTTTTVDAGIPSTPRASETPQPTSMPDAIAIPEESSVREEIEAAAAALSAAVFEQIISATTGDESSDDDDSYGSGGDNDSDDEESGHHEEGNGSSSSSSSESGSEAGPGAERRQSTPHVESEDDDEGDEEDGDDDMVLSQALALSLTEQSQSLRVDTSISDEVLAGATEGNLSSCPISPGSETPVSKEFAPVSEPDDSPLPSLPPAPKFYPYSEVLEANIDSDQIETESECFDPSALHRFGTLPASHVLVYLLRITAERIERRKFQIVDETASPTQVTAVDSTIPGGMGSSLFPPTLPFVKSQRTLHESGSEVAVSLQMLVSLLLLIVDRRDYAIQKLKMASKQEIQSVESGAAVGSAMPASEEGDDPAIALALHYLDEDAGESKESLEAKGMHRKAAAAAHDAAAILKLLRRRTEAWKQQVKLFSHCTLLSMKCLRTFLQFIVRQWLHERQGLSAAGCHVLLPKSVVAKLSKCLGSMSSLSALSSTQGTGISGEEAEEIFLSLRLYQDSVLLWGETVPLVYPSVSRQTDVFRSLLLDCSKSTTDKLPKSLEKLTSWPTSDVEVCHHKAHILCRRLRVSDLLEGFVSSPACYIPEAQENVDSRDIQSPGQAPKRASNLLSTISSLSRSLGGIRGEIQNLYLALCHQCHVRILLWDGLFACMENETDDAALALTQSPGDSIRVSAKTSSSLVFDATKCSDSMAILSNHVDGSEVSANGSSVLQRASKVWGTVLSSMSFAPKSGIHRWAVRLDKCERGHVFVGVATSQASMRTYVGGDKYGWGMIGTQALWHDRRKIRGDYGATFRTGSTIIVTLDSDAGTLSFSTWKDTSNSASFSLDTMVQNLGSPRKHGHTGGCCEDWGVAFEGLPLDSKLYPAVGLYQRDDRVTLVTVESSKSHGVRESPLDLSGGLCYFPRINNFDENSFAAQQVANVKNFNNLLSWDGIAYATNALDTIVDRARDGFDEFTLSVLLPSLATALCLIPPTVPVLSQRAAMKLLPRLASCILKLQRSRGKSQVNHELFPNGLQEGKWIIRATGSSGSSSDAEEYVVDLSPTLNEHGSVIGFEGTGVGTTGKSKNGLVAIFGTVKGSSVHFVEEWTDANDEGFSSISSDDAASSCAVTARVSLDGRKFEGTYRNVQFGTTGQIAGLLCEEHRKVSKFRLKDAPAATKQSSASAATLVSGEALLCLAYTHLATVLGEDASADFSCSIENPKDSAMSDFVWKKHYLDLKRCLSLPLLSASQLNENSILGHLETIEQFYGTEPRDLVDEQGNSQIFHGIVADITQSEEVQGSCMVFDDEITRCIAKLDEQISTPISLGSLARDEYEEARKLLLCTFTHHCNLAHFILEAESRETLHEVSEVWSAARKIMEDGIRSAISERKGASTTRERAKEVCLHYSQVFKFLLSLEISRNSALSVKSVATQIGDICHTVSSAHDIEVLRREMDRSSKRTLLRLLSIWEMKELVGKCAGLESPIAVEALAVGIPRLLGRSLATAELESLSTSEEASELGSHYSANLHGASRAMRLSLRLNVHSLWSSFLQMMDDAATRVEQNQDSQSLALNSMFLALLATFGTVMQGEDVAYVTAEGRLLSSIAKSFEVHRLSALGNRYKTSDESLKIPIVVDLDAIGDREISRSIFRTMVAVSHVVTYQAIKTWSPATSGSEGLSHCLHVVLKEIINMVPLLKSQVKERSAIFDDNLRASEWEAWFDQESKKEDFKRKREKQQRRQQVGRSGVDYLHEHGFGQLNHVPSSSQKSVSRSRGAQTTSSTSSADMMKLQDNFCRHTFSQWLHILVAISKVESARTLVAQDSEWMATLLGLVGLKPLEDETQNDAEVVHETQATLLPVRYRARVLRILLPLLVIQKPDKSIVKSLLWLAGSTSTAFSKNLYEDESIVSREAVSLLRGLHSPKVIGWRSAINESITSELNAQAEEEGDFIIRFGVLLFYNGGVEGIKRGAFVLLKPPAAVALSTELQSSSNSKSHSSSAGSSSTFSGSTPHHIVGNGTEGIVAGLCRDEASAGIVSSIDMKNGVCEVILLNRDSGNKEQDQAVPSSFRKKSPSKSQGGSHGSRHTLTVRALRSSLSDVVNAQEIALYHDDSPVVARAFISMLKDALKILREYRYNEEKAGEEKVSSDGTLGQITLGLGKVSYSMAAIKASLTALSDERILDIFLHQTGAKEIMSELLRIAYSEDKALPGKVDYLSGAQIEHLSALPAREARWVYLMSLLRGLVLRSNILTGTTAETWRSRAEYYIAHHERSTKPDSAGSSGSGAVDGYSTPPVEPTVIPGTPPATATDNNDRVRPSGGSGTRNSESSGRAVSQSTAASENSEEDEDSEAAATAVEHLREAAIAQMAELGLPRQWSELALRRTGGTNIEAAVHFCLERGGEMDRLLAEERERERMTQRQSSSSSSGRRRGSRSDNSASNHLLRQLMEMGFPSRWCVEALAATGNNVDEALTWILTNGERLSAEDEGMQDAEEDEIEDDEDDDDDDDDEDSQDEDSDGAIREDNNDGAAIVDASENQGPSPDEETKDSEAIQGWRGSVIPLRFISGRSIVNSKTLAISGLSTGGFSSVGTKGVLLTSGKWYYEAILETAGCLQIGWADGSFAGHCHAERGDGCGDGPSSWAYDGWRRYRWHATATEWGCRWKEGDVIGCMVDMDEHIISFTLNGRGEEIGMGVAFSGQGFRPCGGVYACVSFNRREKLRLVLGGGKSEPFRYSPPSGYRGVGEAVLDAVKERDMLVAKEALLDLKLYEDPDTELSPCENKKRFICDFSDGEHGHELMAWAHRYYGSDASVHLGSGRSKHSAGMQKGSSSSLPSQFDTSISQHISRRSEKAWSILNSLSSESLEDSDGADMQSRMYEGYFNVACNIKRQVLGEACAMSSLLSRKLLVHSMVTMDSNFDPEVCLASDSSKSKSALRFWKMIEASASLRSAGWIGEAGAMAVAAEALGLGISSNDSSSSRHSSKEHPSVAVASDFEDGVSLPSAGIVQCLSSVARAEPEDSFVPTSCTFVASAEAAIGSTGGGGVLAFLQKGLLGALCRSQEMRDVVLACVRRSVRLLAVVEYDAEDSTSSENPEDEDDLEGVSGSADTAARKKEDSSSSRQALAYPDARLISFMTGLLLSPEMEKAIQDHDEIKTQLFEAWSVGMLSASLPWRMICALTASGILNSCPKALSRVAVSYPTLSRFYSRLFSTVARRAWAERAAAPVCSRYVQAMIELLCSVNRSVQSLGLPDDFMRTWNSISVDAAMPLPFPDPTSLSGTGWESDNGWVSNDGSWETWIGSVQVSAVNWKPPSRSAIRTLMDGGDGPPMLREGCTVIRGLDWAEGSSNKNEDGKDLYEAEKAKRDLQKQSNEAKDSTAAQSQEDCLEDNKSVVVDDGATPEVDADAMSSTPKLEQDTEMKVEDSELISEGKGRKSKNKKKKIASPKLPIGTVLSIEPWAGIPAMARRVRWHLTGEEGIYRYGGDGGRYDISHVEVNEKATRVRKRHPLPESAEQCAARHGFGAGKCFTVLLRLRKAEPKRGESHEIQYKREGVLEWPDLGAGVLVGCTFREDGTIVMREEALLYGAKDSGWEARFGQPTFIPGTTVVLQRKETAETPCQAELDTNSPYSSLFEEICGTYKYDVPELRCREDGGKLWVTSDFCFQRGREYSGLKDAEKTKAFTQSSLLPPIRFDRGYYAPSLSLSKDGRTVSCVSSDGRGTAFASIGFTKGIHYWEVKIEQADVGSVFIGVAEKPTGSGSGSSYGYDSPPRLNRWHGWGFVNFRATYTAGAERIYGAHCHAGDTVGVLLDCDAGRISFFFDGLKYGEHILNDLGCAFENLSPFGFNVDGCGSGGAGQGAPSGIEGGRSGRYPAQGAVRPRALWPVVGLRNHGDRVTFSSKWNSSYGVDGTEIIKNTLALDEIMQSISTADSDGQRKDGGIFPRWFVNEAFSEYNRWKSGTWCRSVTRGSGPFHFASFGLDADLDASDVACASASALLGLKYALLAGDKVRLNRSAGRLLELAEEAVVLGAYQGRLYYRIISQKSEGGSLTEGGGRAWCWDESEVVDGLTFLNEPKGLNIELPLMDRFRCTSKGGLKVVYEGGAVIRSDLEIFDGSLNLGSIPVHTTIPRNDVLERRVNSCGVVRFRVRYDTIEGWISSRIRGGKEEAIIAPVLDCDADTSTESDLEKESSFPQAMDCALHWHREYETEKLKLVPERLRPASHLDVAENIDSFGRLLDMGRMPDMSMIESDAFLSKAISAISDVCHGGNPLDVSFEELESAISFAVASKNGVPLPNTSGPATVNQISATVLGVTKSALPPINAILARVALLRAFNRRAKLALPWLSLRPCQEASAIFGGIYGHGASIERAGRYANSTATPWVQIPTIASRIRALRGIFFTCTKRNLLQSITETTTTPTPLSHDEYELPREIRTVRLNRLKARRVMAGEDVGAQRKHSVFAQLHNETKGWGGAALRRGFVAKGHGGQKRAFKVKLIGEGVNDYSGPYREAFSDSLAEVLNVTGGNLGSLGVLDPTPNNASDVGENRGLFMFSSNGNDVASLYKTKSAFSDREKLLWDSFSSLIVSRNESTREVEDALVFLGRITGTAFRHGIPLDLPLPLESVWKAIVEDMSDIGRRFQEMDILAYQQNPDADCSAPLLLWQQKMLNAFVEGLSNVLPVEVLSILSGEELRDMICGNPDVDVDLLRRVVEYEGYEESDEVIRNFWDTLREFTNEERKSFLQFVWARNRLPMRESDFDAPFKIQKDNSTENGEQALPSASTCFFSLTLPEYGSREKLKEKLLFAINNVTTMETDFQTNSAEIAEGYRAF